MFTDPRLKLDFKRDAGTSLAGQWLRLHASKAGGTSSFSLVGELRSHMPRGVAKKKKRMWFVAVCGLCLDTQENGEKQREDFNHSLKACSCNFILGGEILPNNYSQESK